MTEAQFQTEVVKWAKQFGWRVHAERPARTATGGWRTAIQGDVGFPDLVLVRPPRLIFAELKVGKNKVAPEQQQWLDELRRMGFLPGHASHLASGIEVYEWRPEMWSQILTVLGKR